jgi:hypothetical protein
LTLAVPVQGQDGGSRVSFDGIGFSFDRTLGTGVNITQVRGRPSGNQGLDIPDATHLAFAIHHKRTEEAKALRASAAPGVVRAYRVADLAGYEIASQRAEQLKTLLTDRPDLATYMTVTPDSIGNELPFLPVFPAGQAIRARAQYIDTPQLSGVAYLTVFRQDVSPFAAGDFWYAFQGLSADGTRYVSVTWVIDATMFPTRLSAREENRQAKRWQKYLTESLATLDSAAPDAFTPPLTSLDALVRSITFEGVPASEPSPLASLTPSPGPSASPAT